MELLFPWSLAALALVPAIFLWGLLAPRGRPVVVGSLMLWRRALGGGPAGKPSARVRLRDPLLWLDAGTVLLLVLACARPALRTTAPAGPAATLVIDRAAHMGITSGGPSGPRWRGAQAMAEAVLCAAGSPPIRVISVPGPDGSVATDETTSEALFARRSDAWTPVLVAGAVWPAALAEAARRPEEPVIVATDIAPPTALPQNVFVLAPGSPPRRANAGLARACARIEAGRWWLLVQARADPAAAGPCRLLVDGDGKTLADRPGFLSPGTTAETTLAMDGPPPQKLVVQLIGPQTPPGPPDDGFAQDNAAFLALEPAGSIRVLLAGTPDVALRRALAAHEDTAVVEAPPGAALPAGEADLVVAYAAPLPAGWTGPAAVVAPPDAVGPVRPTDVQAAPKWRVAADHPLAGALYLEPPRLAAVRRSEVEPAAQLLLGTPDAPLMVTWEAGGARRLAVLFAFDEKTTDWPHRAGFPVFWSHALEWLVPKDRRPASYATCRPLEPMPALHRLAPDRIGFHETAPDSTIGVSFIGTDEGFHSGPGRDDSQAAIDAIRRSVEARRRAALAEVWPYLAAAALAAILARAWAAR